MSLTDTSAALERGYLHPSYARSLSDIGQPLALPHSRGWLLARSVPGGLALDAMGCYPIFCCQDWPALLEDLDNLAGLISVALVADPFGNHSEVLLRRGFPDVVIPFKQHFVADLEKTPINYVSDHHQRNVRLALRKIDVERCVNPIEHAAEWILLYGQLTRRHKIRGAAAFSPEALRLQLEVPGVEVFRAISDRRTVGMLLWMTGNDVVYYHLAAYDAAGYKLRASFALFWSAIDYFRKKGVRWMNLGGCPGPGDSEDSGLARFKKGWSTGTRSAYFCGRIYDRDTYAGLLRQGAKVHDHFPGYRWHEQGK